MEPRVMTKAEFARHMGVGKSAVSNWIDREIINNEAMFGEGRKARIRVRIAVDQVRRNRDIGQALGNGIETRTSTGVESDSDTPAEVMHVEVQPDLLGAEIASGPVEQPEGIPTRDRTNTVEDQLKRAKLEEQLRRNRLQASEEALRQGMLVSADDAREQMIRVANMMLQIFEGSLTDFASAITSQFDVPQRDVLHLLKNEFINVRQTATKKERSRIASLKKDTTTSVELDA